jgi:hypothetical protein
MEVLLFPLSSRGVCGAADFSWKYFSMGAYPYFLPRSTWRMKCSNGTMSHKNSGRNLRFPTPF